MLDFIDEDCLSHSINELISFNVIVDGFLIITSICSFILLFIMSLFHLIYEVATVTYVDY